MRTLSIAVIALSLTGIPLYARAETATSRALNSCSKLNGAPYHACLNRIPKCEAWIAKDINEYWHKGMTFVIDDSNKDPGMLCQHGGDCIPVSTVRFKTSCVIVGQESKNGSYYRWERTK